MFRTPLRNYQKSDLVQIIRILKNYDFFKDRPAVGAVQDQAPQALMHWTLSIRAMSRKTGTGGTASRQILQ